VFVFKSSEHLLGDKTINSKQVIILTVAINKNHYDNKTQVTNYSISQQDISYQYDY